MAGLKDGATKTLDESRAPDALSRRARDERSALACVFPHSGNLEQLDRISRFGGFFFGEEAMALLDVGLLGQKIDAYFRDHCVGYAAQLRVDGITKLDLHAGWARKPDDGDLPWATYIPMQIASVSKFFTAVGLVRLLDDHGLTIEDHIAGYLPPHWVQGPNVDQITFRDLLTHHSGLNYGEDGSGRADIEKMREQIALGVPDSRYIAYKNLNFSLCRVLMLRILDPASPAFLQLGASVPAGGGLHAPVALSDAALDKAAISAFVSYMRGTIFEPAGVPDASLSPPGNAAWLYSYPRQAWGASPIDDGGVNAGSSGWQFSAAEVATALGALRRSGAVVTPQRFEWILQYQLGIDRVEMTDLGMLYSKGGLWGRYDPDGPYLHANGIPVLPTVCLNQSSIYFLPGIELVTFCNSQIMPDNDPMGAMSRCIRESIVSRSRLSTVLAPL